nr:cytochrome c oxidase subunit 2 [Dreissena polymorpha]
MIEWGQLGFNDSISHSMCNMTEYHDVSMGVVVTITFLVSVFLFGVCSPGLMFGGKYYRYGCECSWLEVGWTIFPSFILLFLAYFSAWNLYMNNSLKFLRYRAQVMGHQWFWEYSYFVSPATVERAFFQMDSFLSMLILKHLSTLEEISLPIVNPTMVNSDSSNEYFMGGSVNYDSYLPADFNFSGEGEYFSSETSFGRWMFPDKPLFIPLGEKVAITVNTADVMHSWAIPSLGVKMDAVPGRSNTLAVVANYPGIYPGNCSELCGVLHSSMPCSVLVVDLKTWHMIMMDMISKIGVCMEEKSFMIMSDTAMSGTKMEYSTMSNTKLNTDAALTILGEDLEALVQYKNSKLKTDAALAILGEDLETLVQYKNSKLKTDAALANLGDDLDACSEMMETYYSNPCDTASLLEKYEKCTDTLNKAMKFLGKHIITTSEKKSSK